MLCSRLGHGLRSLPIRERAEGARRGRSIGPVHTRLEAVFPRRLCAGTRRHGRRRVDTTTRARCFVCARPTAAPMSCRSVQARPVGGDGALGRLGDDGEPVGFATSWTKTLPERGGSSSGYRLLAVRSCGRQPARASPEPNTPGELAPEVTEMLRPSQTQSALAIQKRASFGRWRSRAASERRADTKRIIANMSPSAHTRSTHHCSRKSVSTQVRRDTKKSEYIVTSWSGTNLLFSSTTSSICRRRREGGVGASEIDLPTPSRTRSLSAERRCDAA